MSAQFSRSSSASLDFPMPGSPTSSTSVPKPIRTGATEAPRTARSRSRSTNGSLSSVRSSARALSRPAKFAEDDSPHRLGLPLHRERLELAWPRTRPPPRERPRRDPDLVLSRASHQARRERRRVAEHGVGPPEARTHLAREHATLAHSDVDRERKALVHDRAHRSEHPLLVVAERLRRARDQDDPSAVAIDVAFEERHAVRVGAGLDDPDEAVERVSCRLGPFGRDHSSVPPNRMNAIDAFRCSPSSGPTSRSCARSGAGTATSSGIPSTFGRGCTVPRTSGAARRSRPLPLLLTERPRLREALAVSALSRISPASDAASISTVRVAAGPVTRSSRCDSPTRKNWKRPVWRPGVHLQLNRAGRRPRSSDRSQRRPHLECRTRRSAA